jgi:glycosyltransferase involved in cell wall biosynthesis
MNKPLISILMPAYNAGLFIESCLVSILMQDFKDWELIIVNDFSTDNTTEIVEQFLRKDSRVRLFNNRVKGIIPALSLAFENSNGTFITRMDADDLMPANKLKILLDELQKRDLKTVVTGKVEYFSDTDVSAGYLRYQDWLNQRVQHRDFYENIYRECIVASPNWMVHRTCFENDIDLNSLRYPEDYDLVFQWYKNKYRIIGIEGITHLWREHENRTSRHSIHYQQTSFFELKTNYFLGLEVGDLKSVQLIGAGKKGKMVANILRSKSIDFNWYEFEPKNGTLADVESIQPGTKTILTNWPIDLQKQEMIQEFLKYKGFELGKNIWVF